MLGLTIYSNRGTRDSSHLATTRRRDIDHIELRTPTSYCTMTVKKSRSMYSSLTAEKELSNAKERDSSLLLRELAVLTENGRAALFQLSVNALRSMLGAGEGRTQSSKSSATLRQAHRLRRRQKHKQTKHSRTEIATAPAHPSELNDSPRRVTHQRSVRFNPVVKISYI